MKTQLTSSFTSADTFPVKIIRDPDLVNSIRYGFIPPRHPQILPTNACNLNCGFCSCRDRNKELSLDFHKLMETIEVLIKLGARAFTITGGGDPLMYPDISSLIFRIHVRNAEVGLVTNGLLLADKARIDPSAITALSWCRVSASDEDDHTSAYLGVVETHRTVDWAISYVLTSKPDIDNIVKHIEFANKYEMTHIRLVSDLLSLDQVTSMVNIRKQLIARGVSLSRVIFQERKVYTNGAKKCLISLLKPVIGADGHIYPCCGVQYATDDINRDMPKSMSMGTIENLLDRFGFDEQKCFDGSVCTKCYYSAYNTLLSTLLTNDISHGEFV